MPEDPYRALFELSPDAILIIEDDQFVECNQAAVDMLRCERKADVLRTHPSDLSPPQQPDGRDSFTKANELMALAFAEGNARFEWHHVRADGEVFPVEVLLTAVPKGGRQVLHVVWRDIAARLKLEEQLRQTQKMEALGRLAGGIAHDFNNLLVAITGNAELLMEDTSDLPDLHELSKEILTASGRAAELTRQLLTFSRGEVLQRRVIDLNEVILGMKRLLARLIGSDVQLAFAPGEHELRVRADRGQLEQVLVNLVTNARDAMPQGGRITVASRALQVAGEPGESLHGLPPGDYAELSVRDEGTGMSLEVAKRAFEPFYTTKEVGRGTGLGLANVYAIVKGCEGEVSLESTLGRGTTAHVWIPLVEAQVEETGGPGSSVAPVPGKGETILVAEDDTAVAALVARVLGQRGYRVLHGAHGRAALDLIEAGARFDLLLADMVMPTMGGLELAAHLRGRDRDLRVVFMSGYLDAERVQSAHLAPGETVLRKPFRPADLLVAVRAALDRPLDFDR